MKTKEKLVSAATRLFGERGFDGVSVRDIIREAHANLGAITYHFGSKDALFAEVIARKIAPFRARGEQVVAEPGAPEQKLRRMLGVYAGYIMYEDPGLKAFFAESLAGGGRLPKSAVEAVEWRNRVFCDLVREGIRDGVFRP